MSCILTDPFFDLQFFEIFKSYPYTASEIDSVFDVIVWPKVSE